MSLRLRLSLVALLATAVVFAAGSILFSNLLSSNLVGTLDANLAVQATQASQAIPGPGGQENFQDAGGAPVGAPSPHSTAVPSEYLVQVLAPGRRVVQANQAAGNAALLIGGYFGTWVDAAAAADRPLSAAGLAPLDATLGAGMIAALPAGACGLVETARITRYLASQSAGQCGPCVFGLDAVAARLCQLADGEPGVECQVDFGRMGLVPDGDHKRVCHALIFTACYSRHCYVWLTFSQTTAEVIAGFEAAWLFFCGVFPVVIPDNMAQIVTTADKVAPRINDTFLEYSQSRGFSIDAARVRTPTDKPRVERVVPYVRESFFRGERFVDLADGRRRAEAWCADKAGMRIHGTTRLRPAEVFRAEEQPLLLSLPGEPYDVPIWSEPKVNRDFHVEVARSIYSVSHTLVGQRLTARADARSVKLYLNGQLIKVHPRLVPGKRSSRSARSARGRRRLQLLRACRVLLAYRRRHRHEPHPDSRHRRHGAAPEDEQGDDRWRRPARGGEGGEADGKRRLPGRCEEQVATAVEPVGHHATERREEPERQEGCGRHETGPSRLSGAGGHEDADGDRLHPRADVRQQRRRPDEREVPRVERSQGAQHGNRAA